ncbi:MAG: hypothetical protein KDD43_09955, partial [Bdellovibrionales bacterium]|nr:hypothetical protein [Bdellovibrionales bacterium]
MKIAGGLTIAAIAGLYYLGKEAEKTAEEVEEYNPHLGSGYDPGWRPAVNFVPTASVEQWEEYQQNILQTEIIPGSATRECPYGFDPRSGYCWLAPDSASKSLYAKDQTTYGTTNTMEPCPMGVSVKTGNCLPLSGSHYTNQDLGTCEKWVAPNWVYLQPLNESVPEFTKAKCREAGGDRMVFSYVAYNGWTEAGTLTGPIKGDGFRVNSRWDECPTSWTKFGDGSACRKESQIAGQYSYCSLWGDQYPSCAQLFERCPENWHAIGD